MASRTETNLAIQAASMRIPVRGLHCHYYADASPFNEAEIYSDQRGLFRDSDSLHKLPQNLGRKDESRRNGESDFDRYKREVTLSRVKNRIFLMALSANTDFYDYALEWLETRLGTTPKNGRQ